MLRPTALIHHASFLPFHLSAPPLPFLFSAPPLPFLTRLSREDGCQVERCAQQHVVGQDGGTQRLGGKLEEKGAHADGVIDEEENEDGEAQPRVERPEIGLIRFLVVFEDRL